MMAQLSWHLNMRQNLQYYNCNHNIAVAAHNVNLNSPMQFLSMDQSGSASDDHNNSSSNTTSNCNIMNHQQMLYNYNNRPYNHPANMIDNIGTNYNMPTATAANNNYSSSANHDAPDAANCVISAAGDHMHPRSAALLSQDHNPYNPRSSAIAIDQGMVCNAAANGQQLISSKLYNDHNADRSNNTWLYSNIPSSSTHLMMNNLIINSSTTSNGSATSTSTTSSSSSSSSSDGNNINADHTIAATTTATTTTPRSNNINPNALISRTDPSRECHIEYETLNSNPNNHNNNMLLMNHMNAVMMASMIGGTSTDPAAARYSNMISTSTCNSDDHAAADHPHGMDHRIISTGDHHRRHSNQLPSSCDHSTTTNNTSTSTNNVLNQDSIVISCYNKHGADHAPHAEHHPDERSGEDDAQDAADGEVMGTVNPFNLPTNGDPNHRDYQHHHHAALTLGNEDRINHGRVIKPCIVNKNDSNVEGLVPNAITTAANHFHRISSTNTSAIIHTSNDPSISTNTSAKNNSNLLYNPAPRLILNNSNSTSSAATTNNSDDHDGVHGPLFLNMSTTNYSSTTNTQQDRMISSRISPCINAPGGTDQHRRPPKPNLAAGDHETNDDGDGDDEDDGDDGDEDDGDDGDEGDEDDGEDEEADHAGEDARMINQENSSSGDHAAMMIDAGGDQNNRSIVCKEDDDDDDDDGDGDDDDDDDRPRADQQFDPNIPAARDHRHDHHILMNRHARDQETIKPHNMISTAATHDQDQHNYMISSSSSSSSSTDHHLMGDDQSACKDLVLNSSVISNHNYNNPAPIIYNNVLHAQTYNFSSIISSSNHIDHHHHHHHHHHHRQQQLEDVNNLHLSGRSSMISALPAATDNMMIRRHNHNHNHHHHPESITSLHYSFLKSSDDLQGRLHADHHRRNDLIDSDHNPNRLYVPADDADQHHDSNIFHDNHAGADHHRINDHNMINRTTAVDSSSDRIIDHDQRLRHHNLLPDHDINLPVLLEFKAISSTCSMSAIKVAVHKSSAGAGNYNAVQGSSAAAAAAISDSSSTEIVLSSSSSSSSSAAAKKRTSNSCKETPPFHNPIKRARTVGLQQQEPRRINDHSNNINVNLPAPNKIRSSAEKRNLQINANNNSNTSSGTISMANNVLQKSAASNMQLSTMIKTPNKLGSSSSSGYTRPSKASSRNPLGPALNTNGKPRAPQGSANDPQSIAARNRRERINARLKILQDLVPNGAKVDLVTMLEKAINYVKFLQLQLRVLSNDELWNGNQLIEKAIVGELNVFHADLNYGSSAHYSHENNNIGIGQVINDFTSMNRGNNAVDVMK